MYKETRENPRQKKSVLLAAGLVCLICFSVMWFTVDVHFAAPLHLLCLVGTGIAVYYILRYALRRYTYSLDENTLTLMLQDSSRLPVIEEIPLSAISAFIPLPPEGNARTPGEERLDFRFSFFREDTVWLLRFRREGKACSALFQPSAELIARLDKALQAR